MTNRDDITVFVDRVNSHHHSQEVGTDEDQLGKRQGARPRLSVVIPVYNERATIEEVLLCVQAVDIDKEIIIVDDGSSDGTREFLQQLIETSEDDPPDELPRLGEKGLWQRTSPL